jgi:hypothetical protein
VEVDQVRYFWAGRDSADVSDGIVRSVELEVYSDAEAAVLDLGDDDDL